MTTFSQCYWEDNAGDYYRCPFQDQDTVFLLSFAIIMLNTDLHKQPVATKSRSGRNRNRMTKAEFLNNLRDVAKDDTLNQEHLSAIYDSVENNPIELLPDDSSGLYQIDSSSNISRFENVLPHDNLGKSLEDILKNVRKSEELLRGLSIHEHRYYTIEDYAEFMSCSPLEGLSDLSQSAFVCTLNYFDGLIKASIKIAHLDPIAVTLCLPLLRHCLCATICLDMMREFRLFSFYLAVIKNLAENKPTNLTTTGMTLFQTEEWFNDLRAALEDHDKIATLKQVDSFVEELEERLRVDTAVRKQMTRVVRRIRQGQFLLTDPTRTFVQEGHLLKKSHRVGRSSTRYHFFLFSDLLIYAKPCSAAPGEELFFVIHEVLSLPTMKIVDWYPRAKKNTDRSFTIHHPRKSFTVVCDSVDERKKWVDAIRKCIRDSYIRMKSTFQEERVEIMSQLSTQQTSSSETTKVSCLRG
jgi:Sec7 domain/PH domain